MSTASPTVTVTKAPTEESANVVLTLGGWRTATERMNRVLAEFEKGYSHIIVRFEPSISGEYDAVLEAQLKAGTAPDLFYLRSFSTSRALYERGYLEPLADLSGLEENFDPARLAPWTTDQGVPYSVPLTAVSHGVYYNRDLFEELDLEVPETWEELLVTARAIEDAGYIPFANGSKDPWTSAEIVFMNLAPSFIGGRQGRMEYLAGRRCFNDEYIVSTFEAVEALAPFFPESHELLGYIDSLQLFVQGKAAMWLSGSWDIPYFEDAEPDFEWSVFAVPAPAGQPGYVTFHPDVGIGLNAASGHKSEARVFLMWMTTPEFAELLGNQLPGFFPMHRQVPTLANAHANAFLALNQGRGTDVRFGCERLWDGSPGGYSLIQEGTEAVLRGERTPQQAADALQAGLVQWFEPAKTCGN